MQPQQLQYKDALRNHYNRGTHLYGGKASLVKSLRPKKMDRGWLKRAEGEKLSSGEKGSYSGAQWRPQRLAQKEGRRGWQGQAMRSLWSK